MYTRSYMFQVLMKLLIKLNDLLTDPSQQNNFSHSHNKTLEELLESLMPRAILLIVLV